MITLDLYFIIFVLSTEFESTKDEDDDDDDGHVIFSAFGFSIDTDSIIIGIRILNCIFSLEVQRVMQSKTKLIRNLRAITYLVIAGILLITNIVIQSFLPFLVAFGLYTLFQ